MWVMRDEESGVNKALTPKQQSQLAPLIVPTSFLCFRWLLVVNCALILASRGALQGCRKDCKDSDMQAIFRIWF